MNPSPSIQCFQKEDLEELMIALGYERSKLHVEQRATNVLV